MRCLVLPLYEPPALQALDGTGSSGGQSLGDDLGKSSHGGGGDAGGMGAGRGGGGSGGGAQTGGGGSSGEAVGGGPRLGSYERSPRAEGRLQVLLQLTLPAANTTW